MYNYIKSRVLDRLDMKKEKEQIETIEEAEEETLTAEDISKLVNDAVQTALKEHLPKEDKPKKEKNKKVDDDDTEVSKEDLLKEMEKLKKENELWRESFNNSSYNQPKPNESKLVKGWGNKK